jgi:hypothetical protein
MKKKLLIAGDSFAADWTKKYKGVLGWVNMLEIHFEVTNVAQAGVSEYKIYKQLENIDTTKFDHIIVSHTSAYRIPIETHPIHKNDLLHNNCDLIFSDVEENLDNPIMKNVYDFYSNVFYSEWFVFVNNLTYKEIHNLIPNAIHITFFDSFYPENVLKFEEIFLNNKGKINHMNDTGNQIIFNLIFNAINKI